MSEVEAWRFLVSRNQFLDYRTVVAPDFMCQVNNSASLLAKTAEGDPISEDQAYYREIYGSKSGDLTIIYRVLEAQARTINTDAEGILKDSFGREILFIEGIVVKGIHASLSITLENLEFNRQELSDDYRDFWEWVSPQPAIPSEARKLTFGNSGTLSKINLSPYVIETKKATESLLKNINEISNKSYESVSNPCQEQSFDFNEEVRQCYFLNNHEILVYLGSSPVAPHERKVVIFNTQTQDRRNLIQGEVLRRSIENIQLSCDKKILISSNKSLMGKDESSRHLGQGLSFLPCFLKAYTFLSNSEITIYEGGGEIIALSKDGKWVINAASSSLNPELFDIKGGVKKLLSGGHNQKITYLASSSYNNVFASGDESGFIRLWNCDTSDSIGGLEVFGSSIDAIAFSPTRRLLVCSGNKGEIKRVSYKKTAVNKESQERIGTHIGAKGRKVKVNDLAFNCDGQIFASAGDDGSIRLWNVDKEDQDGQLFSGHDKSVMSVSFSPDGKLLASGSKDYTVRIWQLS